MIEKQLLLMSTFGWSREHVRTGIVGAQGWVYYNWAIENRAAVWGNPIERRSPGYIRQEMNRILRERSK